MMTVLKIIHTSFAFAFVFFSPVSRVKEVSLVLVKTDGTLKSPLKKLLSVSVTEDLLRRTEAKPGDLLLMAAGSLHTVVQ